MIWAYAITDAGELPPGVAGIEGAPLELVDAGLDVVVSRHGTVDPTPSAAGLLRHEEVVEALMDAGPVLPLRYGSVVADEEELRRQLAPRLPQLHAALERVRGCVEFGVSVLDDGGPATAPVARSGRDYLLSKVDRRRRAAEAIDALRPHAAAMRERPVPPPGYAAKVACLVPRERASDFTRRAGELGDTVAYTGPWPPYSFTA